MLAEDSMPVARICSIPIEELQGAQAKDTLFRHSKSDIYEGRKRFYVEA